MRMLQHHEYYKAFINMINKSRGARASIYRVARHIARNEIIQLRKTTCLLEENCDKEMYRVDDLDWDNILEDIQEKAPMLYAVVHGGITTKKTEKTMLGE